MRIFLLGSTGRTGKLLLSEALKRGHTVHALVRDRKKIPITHANLSVHEGNLLDKTILEEAMNGCEAILSTLNISRFTDWPWAKLRTPQDFLSQVMKSLIEIALRRNVQRIIFISAWGVAETKKDIPGWFRWVIGHSNVRYPYLDHERQETLIRSTSLQWTSVRPAGLTNSKKEQEIIVSFDNDPKPRLTISRRSVAKFILDAQEKGLYLRQMPVISAK